MLEAANAMEALEVFRIHSHQINLAIIDFVMPSTSGLDLAAELGRQRPGLKILYTSGYIDTVAMKCIAHQQPELVLSKPFSQSQLIARVENLMANP